MQFYTRANFNQYLYRVDIMIIDSENNYNGRHVYCEYNSDFIALKNRQKRQLKETHYYRTTHK